MSSGELDRPIDDAEGVSGTGVRASGLRWSWALLVFFSAVPLAFIDLSGTVLALESAVSVNALGGVIKQIAGVASMRYVAYGAALIVGSFSLRWLEDFRSGIAAWLCGYSVWAAVSVLWSVSPVLGMVKAVALFSAIIVVLALQARRNGSEIVVRTTIRVAAVVMLSAIAVAVIFPEYGLDPYWNWHPRLGGQFVPPNDLGEYVGILLLLVLYWPTGWRGYSRAMVGGLCIGVMVATQSRTSLAAAAVSIVLIEWIRANVAVRAIAVMAAAAVLLGVVVLNVNVFDYAGYFGRGTATELYNTIADRVDLWAYGIRQGADSMLLGRGFAVGSRIILGNTFAWRPFHAHNGVVEVFLNLGLVGVTLMAGIVGSVFFALVRLIRMGGAEAGRGFTGLSLLTFLLVLGFAERSFAGELSIASVGLLVAVAIALGASKRAVGRR